MPLVLRENGNSSSAHAIRERGEKQGYKEVVVVVEFNSEFRLKPMYLLDLRVQREFKAS
jgi:hypothetical protein